MERPTDAYKETHNITLSQEDTLFGGQVSNLQVLFLYIFFPVWNNSLALRATLKMIFFSWIDNS